MAAMSARAVSGRLLPALLAALLALAGAVAAAPPRDEYRAQRAQLLREIGRHAEAMARDGGRPWISRRVLAALERVPRHEFVPESQRRHAYENRPLPIGYGQTISQPYIVALMTELAQPEPGDRVLEIGTGSGYQAAVLAELVGEVYSIEIVEPLARQAAQRLQRLGYANVHTTVGDGYYGWKAHAPYDAIVVTAAAPSVPPPLLEQLKPGGRMVIPVGTSFFTQTLMLVEKRADGKVRTTQLLPVRFVPLTRGEAR
ncbi:protein-L-isoaspartate(D-aspartate) O-methyltransferase [Vulcaniibacterium gelatinicum]|uniref:protein-L-isoaspartate(D-aspartate) O-methyltransferase n=1 Tax=Vulcaniibacterium gelatinicum TaxID=2598725 RepID=UPI0011C75686|nr:protein-L-isoaspartate(D-aspartate) O-methyltransferase [Vulcaniibacterium gelatinicum]